MALTTHTSSSSEFKERAEIYLSSSAVPSWPILGWTLPFSVGLDETAHSRYGGVYP